MNVIFYKKPCLLLETTELVFAQVNQIPARDLTADGEFCLPPEEVHRIQKAVCGELRCSEEELQFYFKGFCIGTESSRMSCIARCLVYNSLEVGCSDVDSMIQALSANWQAQPNALRISGMDMYSLSFDSAEPGTFAPLSVEMMKLPIPAEYQTHLVEVFSHYEQYLRRLAEILRPAAARLETLLEPWVQKAQPVAAQWEDFLAGDVAGDFFRNRANINRREFGTLEVSLRYFPAEPGYLRIYEPNGDVRMLIGVAMKAGRLSQPARKEALADWEYTALRLIANPDRLAMLQAMMEKPMSGQDLAQKLGLHGGSVFRDLNSMYNARLLTREMDNGKNVYRTDLTVIQLLSRHMVSAIAMEGNL